MKRKELKENDEVRFFGGARCVDDSIGWFFHTECEQYCKVIKVLDDDSLLVDYK